MKSRAFKTVLLLLGLLFGTANPVAAHDPGLSKARLQILNDEFVLQVTFAQGDIESMVQIDSDDDGSVSAEEFAAVETDLRSIAASAIELSSDEHLMVAQDVLVTPGSSDSIEAELHFVPRPGTSLQATFPIVKRLPRGHRQHLTVIDRTGQFVNQFLLDARTAPLRFETAPSSWTRVLKDYVIEGVWHIWIGFDHVLFLLTLLLPAVLIYRGKQWQSVEELRPALLSVLTIVTAFTAAHTITLVLAVLDIVRLPSRFVEIIIACSVLITAVNNLRPVFPASRWFLAFAFGLLHGFGFASVLVELGLPDKAVAISLFGFSLGVEIGQMAIVALVFPIAFLARHTLLYRKWILRSGSVAAALVASVWMFERVFSVELIGL